MLVSLESTSRVVTINGVPARVWEGSTAAGIHVIACVTRQGRCSGQVVVGVDVGAVPMDSEIKR